MTVGQCLRAGGSVFAMVGQCLQLWVSVCNEESMFKIVSQCLQWWVSVHDCRSVSAMVVQCL